MTRRIKLWALGIAAVTVLSLGSAEAKRYGNCYWDGSSPFCAGSCRSGFVVRGYKACFSGFKVKCCEPMGSVSQDIRRR